MTVSQMPLRLTRVRKSNYTFFPSQVLAVDADSGVNGQIDYTIVDGNRNNAFIIDSIRGILATSAVLDREIVSSYKYAQELHSSSILNI